ncbi:uncharacterized protein LOC120355540 [Nilaparvata lugens]|uniref:uncharacterized protein LOC120355540 n=1 Tax=Nilaparvata lugens TaxID=108931 RepID=UPI00193DB1E5|nr:uncharacterized protein LOC120355540 [Nilaparvata lugens]
MAVADMDTLTAMFEKFKEDINASTEKIIEQEISALNLSSIIVEQNRRIEELGRENEELKRELRKHNTAIESIKRENNLIFYGVKESENETREQAMEKIRDLCNEIIKVELRIDDINFVKRLGVKTNSKVRPIMLSLVSVVKKYSILDNCGRLKNSKIFVARDLDKETREKRRELNEARKLLKDKHNVKVRVNALEIDGKIVSYEDVKREYMQSDNEKSDNIGDPSLPNQRKRKGDAL